MQKENSSVYLFFFFLPIVSRDNSCVWKLLRPRPASMMYDALRWAQGRVRRGACCVSSTRRRSPSSPAQKLVLIAIFQCRRHLLEPVGGWRPCSRLFIPSHAPGISISFVYLFRSTNLFTSQTHVNHQFVYEYKSKKEEYDM